MLFQLITAFKGMLCFQIVGEHVLIFQDHPECTHSLRSLWENLVQWFSIPPFFFGKKKNQKRVAQYVEFEQFGNNIVRPAILFKYCNCWVILWLCAPTFVPYDLYWLSQAIYTALVSGLKPALLSYRWIKKLWKSILPSGLKRWLDLIGNTFTAPSTLQDCHGTMQPSSGSRSLGLGST